MKTQTKVSAGLAMEETNAQIDHTASKGLSMSESRKIRERKEEKKTGSYQASSGSSAHQKKTSLS